MEELTEVITAAEFHPNQCNTFVYSSSKGTIRLCDMRASALCDKHSKCKHGFISVLCLRLCFRMGPYVTLWGGGAGFNLCFFVCLCLPFFFSFRARTQSVTFLIDFFFFVLESRAAVITTLLPPECIHSCIKTSFQSGYTNDMHPFIFFFKCLKSQRIQTTVHSFLKSSHPSPT